jgi:hypothetical protein
MCQSGLTYLTIDTLSAADDHGAVLPAEAPVQAWSVDAEPFAGGGNGGNTDARAFDGQRQAL